MLILLSALGRSLVRVTAFLPKEALELLRQPSLLLSLVIGPFLILALFGMSSSTTREPARTILVIPAESPFAQDARRFSGELGPAVKLIDTMADAEAARARLGREQVDMVVVMPSDVSQSLLNGQRADVHLYYNAVDPVQIAYLEFVAYTMISELNKQVLAVAASDVQREFGDARTFAERAQQYVEMLEQNPPMRQALGIGDQDLVQMRQSSDELRKLAEQFGQIPPDVLVSPFESEVENTAQITPNFLNFYGPAVLALILQHIAVSFTALSMVRERTLGTTELFRVAPITPGEIITSKFVSYMLVTIIVALLLAVLMVRILGIPLVGSPRVFVGALVLLAFASLGIGFVISVVSRTEREAVQYVMLVLIAAVFFSGILFPLDQIAYPARAITLAMPVTYGTRTLQEVMLRGGVEVVDLRVLAAMGLGLFAAANIIYSAQFRRGAA